MLKAIPLRILTTSGELRAPKGANRYGNPESDIYALTRVHLQPSNSVKKTRDNREVVLRSLLFYDAKNSLPVGLDFDAIKTKADELGVDAELTLNGLEYTLQTVEAVPDDRGKLHHYELGLV